MTATEIAKETETQIDTETETHTEIEETEIETHTETEIEIEEEEEAPHLQIINQEDAQIPRKEKKKATNTIDPKGRKIKLMKDLYRRT